MKKALNVFLVLALLFSFNVITLPISKAATTDATLLFNPASYSADTGEDFDLVAQVNPGSNTVQGVNAVQLDVTFDHTVLQLSSITAVSPFTILGSATINNTTGAASVALYIPGDEVTVTSDVATLDFHAEAAGTSSVAFALTADAAVNDGNGTLVVGTRTPATVTVTDPEEPGDTTAPVISNGTPSGELSRGTTSSTISVTTNENATCKYSTSSGVAYASMTGTFTTTGTTTHSFAGTGFSNGNDYRYYVRCQDSSSNVNASDYTVSFSIDKSSSKKKEVKKKKRKIYNSQKKLRQGEILVQRGKRFSKNSTVMLYFSKFGGGYYAPMPVTTSGSGTFSVSYRINKPRGTYSWYALDTKTGKKSKTKTYRVR